MITPEILKEEVLGYYDPRSSMEINLLITTASDSKSRVLFGNLAGFSPVREKRSHLNPTRYL
jgi:hypothetical protein